jgi:hypothetical protein
MEANEEQAEEEWADVVAAHEAHSFPSRQVSVAQDERVRLLKRGDEGWHQVQKVSDGWAIGWVPAKKLHVLTAGELANEAIARAELAAEEAGIDRSETMNL